MQLEFIQRTWTTLHEEHQKNQTRILAMLNSKLESSVHKLQGLLKNPKAGARVPNEKVKVKRWKYLFVKPFLDTIIHDLDKWQRLYDPSWFLIMTIASPAIDVELRRRDNARSPEAIAVLKSASKVREALNPTPETEEKVFLPAEGAEGATITKILYSLAVLLRRSATSSTFIIDSVPCPTGSYVSLASQDMRRLASKLRCADPLTFGVLRCRGVMKIHANNGTKLTSFDVIFEKPSPEKPHTLRSYLLCHTPHSLSERMGLAKRLATSVSYVHTLGFVHKSIRPENILGFGAADGLGVFFLIGFEQVRSADGKTYMRGDDAMEKNLYRHPE